MCERERERERECARERVRDRECVRESKRERDGKCVVVSISFDRSSS